MRKPQILAIAMVAMTAATYAGWSDDVRLTFRHFEIYPQVAARNDTVHVVWQQIAGTMHVSYLRSTDGGNVWSEIRNLEDTATHYGVRQDLWLTPDYVFVGWEDLLRDDPVSDIGFTFSVGGGRLASPWICLWASRSHVRAGCGQFCRLDLCGIPFQRT